MGLDQTSDTASNKASATVSDSVLMKRAQQGDEAAFATLVTKYEPAIAATVVGMLGRCAEARDVGQQVFIRFYRSMDKFRGDASVKTYLTRIAINLALNEIKRRKRQSERYTSMDDAHGLASPNSADVEDAEKRRIVQGAIEQLDERFRTVVVLRMMNGYSVKETAELLDLPSGTVLSRLSRAQTKLAEILKPYVTE